jgi:peroxiredoxin
VKLFQITVVTVSFLIHFGVHADVALPSSISAVAPGNMPANVIAGQDLVTHQVSQIDLNASSTKATIVVFLSAKCPCSGSHEQTLKDLAAKFSPKGFQFVAVHSNVDEDPTLASQHFSKASLPFPVLQDDHAALADRFGALKTPHVFVLKQGEVVFQGGVDDSKNSPQAKEHFLLNALNDLDQGKLPEVKQVRALGCIIKRKD